VLVRYWSGEEDAFLRENFNSMDFSEIGEELGRTAKAVKARVAKLRREGSDDGLSHRIKLWTEEECDLLVEMYPFATDEELVSTFGVNYKAIVARVARLNKERGIRLQRKDFSWSKEEEQLLLDKFRSESIQELEKLLGRSRAAIHVKVGKLREAGYVEELPMKKEPFSEDELEYIRDNYNTMTNIEIGKRLGRATSYITTKAQELGLKPKSVRWGDIKEEVIKNNWNDKHTKDLARSLGVTERQLMGKAKDMGLSIYGFSGSGSMTTREVSSLLGVSMQTVRNWMISKKLRYRKINSGKASVYRIGMGELVRYVTSNPDCFDFRRADVEAVKLIFAEVNSGSHIQGIPDWLNDKMDRELSDKSSEVYDRREWTLDEMRRAAQLKKSGKTYREIGERLGRSRTSVAARLQSDKHMSIVSV